MLTLKNVRKATKSFNNHFFMISHTLVSGYNHFTTFVGGPGEFNRKNKNYG
jgi:hypothetical protein